METSLQDQLRQKMRELRDIGGYSQKDMADAMEITQPSFFKIQNGQIDLSIHHISGCAELFDVSPVEFISLTTEELAARIKRKPPPPSEKLKIPNGRVALLNKGVLDGGRKNFPQNEFCE